MTCPVAIFRDRFAKAWPKHAEGDRVYTLDLSAALDRTYSTDAHFAAYVPNNGRRLSRDAVDHLEHVALTAIVFDVDCADVHGTAEPAPDQWRSEMADHFDGMQKHHPGGFLHFTRGGARIVYRQAEPTLLCSAADAQEWRQGYAVALAYLQRRYGIVGDAACSDWQRLFRLPHATRDGGKPERWGAVGDVEQIGALEIQATAEDVATAKRASKAFRTRQHVDLTGITGPGDGFGVLFHVLQTQGAVGRRLAPNAYAVRCPNESQHTTGSTGDGSTVLYLPDAAAQEIGTIHCLHSHCSAVTPRDWLGFFSDSELSAARERAGLTRRSAA